MGASKFVVFGSLLGIVVACGDSKSSTGDDDDGSGAESGAPSAGSGGRGGGSSGSSGNAGNSGSSGTNAGKSGGSGGRDGSGGTTQAGGSGAPASGGDENGGAADGGTDGSAGTSGGGGTGGSSGPTLGPRCTDCETLCVDEALTLPEPLETCTEPSLFRGLGVRIDLTVTLPDDTKRYLVDSPFDHDTDHYPSWSFDSLGARWYKQPVVCGEVSLSGIAAGVADPESTTILTVTVDEVAYRSDLAPASVTLTTGQPLRAGTDDELGPIFDLVATGTLVAESGDAIEVEGHIRNVAAGFSERGLARYTRPSQDGVQEFKGLVISGDSVVAGPISLNAGTTGALELGRDLTNPAPISLADHVLRLAAFSDGGLLGTGNLDNFLVAFEPSGALRWRTPVFTGDWLFTTYESPLARADGSGCMAVGGPSFADPAQPAVLACSDPQGAIAFQSDIYPIIEPLSPTELADGTIVMVDARSPEVHGYSPDGTQRFAFAPCTPPASGAQTPYFSLAPAARNTDGGAVAAIGDDLIAFDADGTVRWRSAVPQFSAEPLVAADGSIYVFVGGSAGLVALDQDGDVKWMRPLGSSGSLVGLAEDGTVYVVTWGWSDYGLLAAVNADGSVAWSVQTATSNWRLAANGDLYGYETDVLELVHGDSPMADAPWPAPRGGERRAGTR
jgi:hypothetical protein